MWPAVLALIYIAVLCTVGIFHKAYLDNILQQWGLVMASLSCLGLIAHVIQFDYMTWPCGLMLGGLVLFATGTAAKVAHFQRMRAHRNNDQRASDSSYQ